MKNILLLVAQKSLDDGMTHPQELAALLEQADGRLRVSFAVLEDLLFHMDDETADVIDVKSGKSLSEYGAIYFRYWGEAQGHAIAAARFCKMKGIPFVDQEVMREGSLNKVTQYMNLFEAGVPIPKTLIGQPQHLLDYYGRYGFVFPLIVKSKSGTRGQDNYLARSEPELRKIFEDNPDIIFVMQSFIPNEGDYRVVVMGDKVVAVIERKASGDSHLNNTSQGGGAEWVPVNTLPDDVLEMSVRAAQFFRRDIAGVDIVRSLEDGKYYCFEVNRAPQIERASFEQEKAKLLAEYLADL